MKKKIFSLFGLMAVMAGFAYAALVGEPASTATYDFDQIAPITTDGTGNLKGSIVDDGGSSWSSLQNNAAVTDAELTISAGVPYELTKGLKFTAGGSGWIHFRNYPEENGGKQFFSNNKDLKVTVPAAAGQYIVFSAYSASGATMIVAMEGDAIDTIDVVGNGKYIYQSKTGDVTFNLKKQLTVKKIEVVNEMPEGVWNFNTIAPIETDGTGNLKGAIVDDGGANWTNLQNNAAITDAELTLSEGVPYSVTKGLKFTAGGSGWIHLRNYPQEYNGKQLFSNNKDLKVTVPAKAGQYIVFEALSASGNTNIVCGDQDITVYPGGFTGYMVQANEDNPTINIKKQLTIKKIFVTDKAPFLVSTGLSASMESTTLKVGDKANVTFTSNNPATPVFKSLDEEVATVDNKGVVSAVSAGMTTIQITQPANAFFKETLKEIRITVENAGPTELAAAVALAIEGKAAGETATVTLDGKVAYTLEGIADAGLVNLVINGNGAKVTLSDSVQIVGQAGIEINEVNFDCAANTKLAPVALSSNPDESLKGPNIQTEGTSLRSNAFYNLNAIVLNGCNFSEVKTPLVSANKTGWNLAKLAISNVVAQFDVATGIDSYINWYGNSSNEGSIKEIVIENSTLYNIVESNDNYFLRYQNASNSQPQKAWAEPQFDGKCSWTMTNNTFVNLPSNKNFANNYPNKNPLCEFTWTGNIFYNTTLLQKAIQGNVANFTAADNSIWGVTNAVDATDASKFATVDSTLVFTTPTAALDLTNVDLTANFTPYGLTYAGQNGFGDPRWKADVKPASLALAADTIEYQGIKAPRSNTWTFNSFDETYQILCTTSNTVTPIVYTSSDEAVATVDATGMVTPVAPGTAIITMSQEPTEQFTAATLEVRVKVMPELVYEMMLPDEGLNYKGINLCDILAPFTLKESNLYEISDDVTSYIRYFDATGPAQVQTSNRKAFIDPATDAEISGGAAIASTDGSVTVAPIAGTLNAKMVPSVPKTLSFFVCNTDSVKFYYTGSSGSGTTVTMWVLNEAGDTVATVEGGEARGKGTTSNTLTYALPDDGNYKLALWGTAGDMQVYYAKFFCDSIAPAPKARKWDFSKNATNYAAEWAAIQSATEYWSDGGTRITLNKDVTDAELTLDGTTKIKFTEGLFWTAAAGKILLGNGSSKNYQCIQTQKGASFYIPNVSKGDTIKLVACAPSKAGTFEFANCEPATIDFSKSSSYTEFVVVATADGNFVYTAPQDIRLQSIMVTPCTEVPTGINEVNNNATMKNVEGIFNLRGQKVSSMKAGEIYIIQGKKYLAK